MRILADENFPGGAVVALRQQGHDVAWVRTDTPGLSDIEVLDRAVAEDRTIVTFDKDFGELAFRRGLPSSPGIVLFRIRSQRPSRVVQATIQAFETGSDWTGRFSVVEDDRIRSRPLP